MPLLMPISGSFEDTLQYSAAGSPCCLRIAGVEVSGNGQVED